VAGTGFEVAFEITSTPQSVEGYIGLQAPRGIPFTVAALSSIVLLEAGFEILGSADVIPGRIFQADQDVDVVHIRTFSFALALSAALRRNLFFATPSSKPQGESTCGEEEG